ncbi:hypothetical protein D3C72_2412020 [compost metagenome]
MLMMAHNFLNDSAHPVANYCIADLLAGRNSDAELLYLSAAEPVHHKLMVGKRFAMAVYAPKVRPVS